MDKRELTVRESIVFCIENGIESAKSQLASFDKSKPNRLRGDQIDALKKSLECFYHHVEITGGGKRGKVILAGLKKEVTQREDGRTDNTRPIEESTSLMNEFIFNQLLLIVGSSESTSLTLSKWYEYIGLFTLEHNEIVSLHETLKEKYRPHGVNSLIGMREEVKAAMNERIYYVHDYAFKQLEKANRIEIDYVYKSVITDEIVELMEDDREEKVYPIQKLTDKQIDEIQKAEEDKANELGVTFGEYQRARLLPRYAKKKVKDILPEMDKMLVEKFGIKSYFREVEISIVNPEIVKEVGKKEARKAFVDRTLELHLKKCEKDEYKKAKTYSKKFFRLNFLILLQLKGAEGLEDEIQKELFTLKFRIEEIKYAYIEELAEENLTEDQKKLVEIGVAKLEDFMPKRGERLGDGNDLIKEIESTTIGKIEGFEESEEVTVTEETKEYIGINHKALIERFNNEPLSNIAKYVNDELGDFFVMDNKESTPLEIESVMPLTNSKIMIDENLTSSSISQLDLVSTEKVKNIELNQKERDELNRCLLKIEFAFTQVHDVRLSA